MFNSTWRSATESGCAKLRPEDCRWFVDHSSVKEIFKPIWFNGGAFPSPRSLKFWKNSASCDESVIDANVIGNEIAHDLNFDVDSSEDEPSDEFSDE